MSIRDRSIQSWLVATLAGLAVGLAAGPAAALSVPLSFDFADGGTETDDFGTITVTEDGTGGLFFEVELGPDLGPEPDLTVFYFNLTETISGLVIESEDDVQTLYSLLEDPAVRGGAGSDFDFAVHFGEGSGEDGNGVLASATFTISADVNLAISDLLELSSTAHGTLAQFAVHVHGRRGRNAGSSATVGAVPEPTTALLLGGGLLAIAAARRRALDRG